MCDEEELFSGKSGKGGTSTPFDHMVNSRGEINDEGAIRRSIWA